MKSHSILIVEDQADVRAALRRALKSDCGTVYEASGGKQALEIVRREQVDLVLTDYDMPGMNGLELLQHVRLRRPEIRRILLTGRADVHVAARALNEGAADRFLLKPWDSYELKGIVDIALLS